MNQASEIVRRRVHPEVATRRKKGFGIPVEDWLLTKWRGQLDDFRAGTVLEKQAWTEPGSIGRATSEAIARQSIPSQLWRLLVFESWLRKHAQPVLAHA